MNGEDEVPDAELSPNQPLAMFRLPVALGGFDDMQRAMAALYGKSKVERLFAVEAPDGWLTLFAKDESPEVVA